MLCFAAELAGPCCRPDLDDLGGGRAATQRRRLSAAEAVGTHTRKATALSSPQWTRKQKQCLRRSGNASEGSVFGSGNTPTKAKALSSPLWKQTPKAKALSSPLWKHPQGKGAVCLTVTSSPGP